LCGGREVIRYRIEVLMDFTTEAGLRQILPLLHDTPTLVGTKRLRTYIHSIDPMEMCDCFALKYEETTTSWKKAKHANIPPSLEVEHGCTLRRKLVGWVINIHLLPSTRNNISSSQSSTVTYTTTSRSSSSCRF
jgi:hypothetical protein